MSSLGSKQGPRYRHVADETEPYETIGVEKLTPIIGAEISGVDLGKLVSDPSPSNRTLDEIHRGGVAFGRVLRCRAADGLDPPYPAVPAERRRHAVRQHVCGL
jgi:hypothetical protein